MSRILKVSACCIAFLTMAFCSSPLKVQEPNLIVITIDTLRADHLSCYGYRGIVTPNIDSLADEGMLFSNAVCQVPLTLPSHCCIFTGKYPPAHGVRHNGIFELPQDEVTLAEILRDNGFETGAFIGSYVLNSCFGLRQGFNTYSDIKIQFKDFTRMKEETEENLTPERAAEDVNHDVFRWLDSVKDKRFFAWIHYYDPHYPYDPPAHSEKKIRGTGYDAEINYSDQCLGDLLKKLEEHSLLDTSIILFCSDHGEGLGEHDEQEHGIFIYDYSIRIPLIIRAPWMIKRGSTYTGLFETVDIMPTILGLLGITSPSTVQGKDFAHSIRGGKLSDGKSEAYAETFMPTLQYGWSDLVSIRKDGKKYIEAPIPEVYDLLKDPKELTNLYHASDEESRMLKVDLQDLISRITPEGNDSLQIQEIDEDKVEVLKSLGYLSGDYFRQGKIDLSKERVDPKLNIGEKNIFWSGEELKKEGKYKEAISVFREVLSRNPKNYQAKLYIIECFRAAHDYASAEAETVEAIKIAELDQVAMKAMASRLWNLYGFILEKKGDLSGAEHAFRKDYELNARNERSFAFLVNFYMNQKKHDKALEIINDVLTIDPDNILANTSLFYLHVEEKHMDQAAEIAKKLVHWDLSGDSHTLLLAANTLKAKGLLPEAAMAFDQVAKMKPQDTEILGNLGSLNLIMGNHIEAERNFERILQIDPDEYKAHFYLGIIALKRNDEQGARHRFDRVLALEPTHYPVFDALGSWLKEKGRIEEAKEEFRKALSLNPNDQIALRGLKESRQ